VHNAAKGRVPILIFAGASPFTQEGELPGSRNEFIQWIQDVHDQRGLVRGYMKYDAEFRTGRNIKQITHRAAQIARSQPQGPVYLMGAREVMEEIVPSPVTDVSAWAPVRAQGLLPADISEILAAIDAARRPLIVTSYAGRNSAAVAPLVRLAESCGIGVLESVPVAMNFPTTHPLYQGNQWNHPRQNEALAAADYILVVDSDVPWISAVSKPDADAVIHHIDCDVLKRQMPLWHIPATAAFEAHAATALAQLAEAAQARQHDRSIVAQRWEHWQAMHDARAEKLAALEANAPELTGEIVTAMVRPYIDQDTIVLSEGISHYHTIVDHLHLTRPGSLHASGGGSLGWHGGAAIGAKLAAPDKTIVAMTGDGSYMFSVPSSVHWMSRRYDAPFVTIIFNNRGWKSPKLSTLAVHPDGYASRANDIGVAFDPPPDYAGIAAAAGGSLALIARTPQDFEIALETAFQSVRHDRRSAVIDAWLPHL
jgi:acetolactate synthase-1/2/3 large subunit